MVDENANCGKKRTLEYISAVNQLFVAIFFRRNVKIVANTAETEVDNDFVLTVEELREFVTSEFDFFVNWKGWVNQEP